MSLGLFFAYVLSTPPIERLSIDSTQTSGPRRGDLRASTQKTGIHLQRPAPYPGVCVSASISWAIRSARKLLLDKALSGPLGHEMSCSGH